MSARETDRSLIAYGSYFEHVNRIGEMAEAGEISIEALEVVFSAINAVHHEAVELREQIDHLTEMSFDPVTGLPKKAYFFRDIEQRCAELKRDDKHGFALGYWDLDNLKKVNDQLGHDQGDKYIKVSAQSIEDQLRKIDRLYHIGGDEFVAIFPGVHDDNEMEAIEGRIGAYTANRLDGLRDEFKENYNKHVDLAASFGYSIAMPEDNPQDVYKRADSMMYTRKLGAKSISAEHIIHLPNSIGGSLQPSARRGNSGVSA